MTNEQQQKINKKRIRKVIEASAPNESKSEVDEPRATKTKKTRHDDQDATLKSTTVDNTLDTKELDSKKVDSKFDDTKATVITAAQIIAKNLNGTKPEEQKHKSQLVGFDTIKLISKIMYLQKKNLGLKLTGDELLERKVDVNNHRQIQQHKYNQYQMQDPNPSEPGIVTFTKTVRRIEQEAKVMSETYDQIFEKVPVKAKPYDFYEQ